MSNRANIIYWNQEYRNDFIRLNREWIERYFRLIEMKKAIHHGQPISIVYLKSNTMKNTLQM